MPFTSNNVVLVVRETSSRVWPLPPGGGSGWGFTTAATPYFSFEQSRCVIFFSVAYALAEALIIGFRIFMSASYQSDV
jgi:hypothetical protein